MNIKIWNQISFYFSETNLPFFLNGLNLLPNQVKKKIYSDNIFLTSKKKKYRNIKNTTLFLEKIENKTSFLYRFNVNLKKVNFLVSSPTRFIFYKTTKSLIFITSPLVHTLKHKKYHKKIREFFLFNESEILLNFNYTLESIVLTTSKKFQCIEVQLQYSNKNFNFYKNLFFFFIKKINKPEILIEKKKLKYQNLVILYKILPEITCEAAWFSSSPIFFVNSMRLSPETTIFVQIVDYLKNIFLRPFSNEGTAFLSFSLLLQFEKLFNLKEIFNKIPTNRTRMMFRQFSKFLIQKNNHQDFILHALTKISGEKIIMGNILIILKCILKIQEKIQVTCTSLIIYNLVIIFRENFDLILKADDFFHSEVYFLPISCNIIDKDIHFSILKKEKEIKDSFNFFFSSSIVSIGFPYYLKFFLIKILCRLLKKPKYAMKNYLVEMVLKIIKKIPIISVQNKNEKIYQVLKLHCSVILKSCNISRLFFIYQKEKKEKIGSMEKKKQDSQLKKKDF